jgi:hypothetical protein
VENGRNRDVVVIGGSAGALMSHRARKATDQGARDRFERRRQIAQSNADVLRRLLVERD